MADHSAAVLAEIMLAGDEPELINLLAGQLAVDPPLTLWTVCRAARNGLQPRCVEEAARWLARHALRSLQWDDQLGESLPPAAKAEQYAERITAALRIADLARRLAGEDRQAADEAYLLGLLHEAERWLTLTGGCPAGAVQACLPEWLIGAGSTPAAACVAEAVEALGSDTPPPSLERMWDQTRRDARDGRRRWLEVVPGAANLLPLLTLRLARLEELENRFRQTLEREKLEAMAEFAAGAGHEINNPLAVIAGRVQLFLQDETDPERRRALALMNAQAKRVYEMIADMRLFARPPRPCPEPVDLVELVDRVITELALAASERATSLSRTGEAGPLEIEADPTQLTVALKAICRNSLEAISHDGRIEIDLRGLDREVEIRLSDDGPGIPPEVRRHLFDPFYSARQAGRGLGLGLSKCWRIVTNHGGRIETESRIPQGTVFTITLPQRQAESLAASGDQRPTE